MALKSVTIYTDGACSGNPGPGGWAAILQYGDQEKILSGGEALTTNNRMELQAAISALAELKMPCQITLYTDSRYVQQGAMEWLPGWKRKGWQTSGKTPVKNVDLWQTLDKLMTPHKIEWCWVKAHNGHLENERVDTLARAAIIKT